MPTLIAVTDDIPLELVNTGVYQILNTANGKVYVGGAYKSFEWRWKTHRRDLKYNVHCNSHLQHAWNKYGSGVFVFKIIERCEGKDKIEERETHWIGALNATDGNKGYNQLPTGGSRLGAKASDELKAQLSASAEMMEPSKRQKIIEAVSKAKKGSKTTDEQKKKQSESVKRALASPEIRKKMSDRRKGYKCSDEMRAKMSKILKDRWAAIKAKGDK